MPPEYPGYLCSTATATDITCAPKPNPEFADVPVDTFFCNNPDITSYEVDFAERPSNLYNFYTSLDLCCKPKRATALIAMAVFAGSAIGCLFMPRLGDLWGRKPIFCASLAI